MRDASIAKIMLGHNVDILKIGSNKCSNKNGECIFKTTSLTEKHIKGSYVLYGVINTQNKVDLNDISINAIIV